MNLRNSRSRLLALVAIMTLFLAAAYGQQGPVPNKEKKATPSPRLPGHSRSELAVIQIKHLPALEVQQQLSMLLSDETVRSVPVGNNALAVSASPETLQEIRNFVAALDVESGPGHQGGVGQELLVLKLENSEDDEDLQHVLGLFGNVQYALDRPRHSVVLTGPQKDVQEAVRVLRQLEQQHPARPADKIHVQTYRVRVVWLANYPGVKEVPRGRNLPVPPDLNEVQADLAKMGIGDLRLVSQSVVSTNGEEFQLLGKPPAMSGGPMNARLLIKGTHLQAVGEGDSIGLDLSLDVADPDEPKAKLCQLSTRIVTSSGHLIVLGVTPAEESTSVFVIQILAQ
jgi:hypothetical protein